MRFLYCAVLLILAGCESPTATTSPPPLPPDETFSGAIVLGSPSLTAGIPGTGPLAIADIKQWLANPQNHEVLKVALPLGLRSAEPLEIPAENALTRAKIELGRQLFFDRRLSHIGSLSCADCHHPGRHFTSDEIAHHSLRETAAAFNRVLGREQFWDGRAKSLEDQIRFPLENEHEMHTTSAECIERIGKIEGYRLQLEALFGKVDFESLCAALAAFQRTIVTGPSAWDYAMELQRLENLTLPRSAEDERSLAQARTAAKAHPVSDAARRGGALFFSARADCSRCHSGPNFTDEQYHDVGLRARTDRDSPVDKKVAADLGRFAVTGVETDRYAFKTPTLRNVAHTWPYFHDGRYHRLSEAVAHFVRGGDAEDSDITPLDLTPAEIDDLVAFLEALTGELPQVATDRLPP